MNHSTHRPAPDSVVESVAHVVGILDVVLDHHPLPTGARRTLTYAHNTLTGPQRYETQTPTDVAATLAEVLDLDGLGANTRAALDRARVKLTPSPAQRVDDSFTPLPYFKAAPGVLVSMSTVELPARYPLLLTSEEHEGCLVVGLVINAALTVPERARWVRRAAERGQVLSPELAEQIAAEFLRRDAVAEHAPAPEGVDR